FEVIDLARTNERLPTLVETVRTSLQINPDILVLFVGNNWNLLETPEVSPYAPSLEARRRYALALREEGIRGPVRLARERLRKSAREALDTVALIARTVRIPVVLIVPEVNLADWETRQPPVRLSRDGVARWQSLYWEAGDRLDRGDFEGALAAAREMLDLDGGTCPSSWRLLARAWRGLGSLDEARQAARAEIDAVSSATLCFLSAPQATTGVQDMLRHAARTHGFLLVDLPEVFISPLPDRRLFLDYCHLTTEGIHLAMAAVAAEVLNISGMLNEEVSWRGLLSRLPTPEITPEAEATARLGAALHTGHRLLPVGAKAQILEYWCEAALDASPGIAEAMLDLIAARSAPCPAVLTAAQQRNLSSPYRLTFQHGWRWDHLDADVIEAITTVLERRGRPVREEVARGLMKHHGLREAGTDLADPFYLWEPLERFYPEVMSFEDVPRRGTLRSPWPKVSFCLVCDATKDVELIPSVRLPQPGEVRVAVNGAEAGAFEAGNGWTRTSLRIPRDLLRPGLNRLTLFWPALPATGEDPLRPVLDRLESGIAADLHPVFGEIFSILARPLRIGGC
ncbi:MAG: tetratricopeptide repeat protein, partial [Thermoanaerobaculia bacterium]